MVCCARCSTKVVGRSPRPSAWRCSSAKRCATSARIEAETGKPFTEEWLQGFYQRRNVRLLAELKAVQGAVDAVAAIHRQVEGRIACASGADRAKVVMQLDLVGMRPYFSDRIFSGHDQPRSKPAPDVYLAAAAHLGIDPTRCLVVEDTATGAQAGIAAGATVWGYCPEGHGRAFDGLPVARVFGHMDELRSLFAAPLAG